MATGTARERVRAEITREITDVATMHLGRDGAAGLSLRAVARDLGMASSAVYRYFPSRDDLLTALIVEAYGSLGQTAEAAESQMAREDLLGRWLAVCHAVRGWAREHPHEYALLYGSPVPGYAAPEDTIGPAARVAVVLGGLLADGQGQLEVPTFGVPLTEAAVRSLAPVRAGLGRDAVQAELLFAGLTTWVALFGAVSFELFGHLVGVVDDVDAWFEAAMTRLAGLVGIVGLVGAGAGAPSSSPNVTDSTAAEPDA